MPALPAMVQIDVPLAGATAMVLALLARDVLVRAAGAEAALWRWRGAAFTALLFLPAGHFFLWYEPAWDTMYQVAPAPGGAGWAVLAAVFTLATLLAGYFGFWAAQALIARGRRLWALAALMAVYAAVGGYSWATRERFLFVGAYEEFRPGAGAVNWGDSRLPTALAWVSLWGAGLFAVWIVWALRAARRTHDGAHRAPPAEGPPATPVVPRGPQG